MSAEVEAATARASADLLFGWCEAETRKEEAEPQPRTFQSEESKGRAWAYRQVLDYLPPFTGTINQLQQWLRESGARESRGRTAEHAGRASGFARALFRLIEMEKGATA